MASLLRAINALDLRAVREALRAKPKARPGLLLDSGADIEQIMSRKRAPEFRAMAEALGR